jgi:hypothetical protein
MTLAPLFFSASRLPLLSLLLLCHLTISLPLASPSSRFQQLPTIQSTFPSAQPTLLPLRVLTCTFWSRVPPPFHEVTMRIHSYAATVSLIPEANHSFPPANKQTHSLPTPPGYTYHPTTRGLNLPGAPNPSPNLHQRRNVRTFLPAYLTPLSLSTQTPPPSTSAYIRSKSTPSEDPSADLTAAAPANKAHAAEQVENYCEQDPCRAHGCHCAVSHGDVCAVYLGR